MDTPANDAAFKLCLPASAVSAPRREIDLESIVIHLFDQHQARLANYVVGFGLPMHDAEDIVQETFLALFRHLQLDRSRSNLHGWLFRVAHNLALKRRVANSSSHKVQIEEEVLARHPCPRPNAEQEVAFSQTQQRLRAVVEALPELDRQCLYLRSEGLKYRQIAEVLGISLGGVAASLSRSLERIIRANGSK